jgi:hypothetical protein
MTDMFTTLRTLDPADADLDPHSPRARADLERILAVDRLPVRPRRRLRLAVAAATVVTATAGFFVVSSLTTGDTAFATWTAAPTGLSAEAAAEAGSWCRDQDDMGYQDELKHADVVIAERRGEWTLVTLAGAKGFAALCITDDSAVLSPSWFGSIGTPANYRAPGPRAVVATDLGTGSIGSRGLSLAAGYAGSDVTGVTYDSVSHGQVVATVAGGRFALWLPGDELEEANHFGVKVQVTYRDGSTATVELSLR